MTSSHDQLERDLRAALRSVDHVPVSGDAWQQNQRRLAAAPNRRLPWLVSAAAVVLAVLLIGGLLALVTGGRDSGTPANDDDGSSDSSSSDEFFADENLLGPIVEVERLTIDGKRRRARGGAVGHVGQGPEPVRPGDDRGRVQRWRRLHEPGRAPTTSRSRSTGCRAPRAAATSVACLAGVDERVMKVQIWMDNGDMTLADLKPGTWEGTKLFALTVPADGPTSAAPGRLLRRQRHRAAGRRPPDPLR